VNNIENALKNQLIDTSELKHSIETINTLSKKLSKIDTKLETIEIKKVDVIDYLYNVAIISNEFLYYSHSIYDKANEFLEEVINKGLNPVSIKEITNIEIDLDKKDNEIIDLNNRYNSLTLEYDNLLSEYTELKKTLFILTSQD